ncbi:MAG TPA: serine--tRNA ligase [Bacteroidia bacterium]|jgi:seryl-tRNA synthetase|nr:serine--tRNA ligase [Bacteroidia bacterium]
MLELSYIRRSPEEVISRLATKNFDAKPIVDEILAIDEKRRANQTSLDAILAQLNKASREIGELYKLGKKAEADELKLNTTKWKEDISTLESEGKIIEVELHSKAVLLPNTPHASVPKGKTPEDNEVFYTEGAIPVLSDKALPHWELTKKYDIIDFELGVKITGAGFPVYKGKGAKLQRALINFFLDKAFEAGYTEIQPPILINEDSGYGTGQLPDKEGQMYFVNEDKLYLIPTAEVPITNIYRDMILDASSLPVKNCGYTPCFRREAGSYGKDVRGLNRLHQFDKVEIVQIRMPEESYTALEEMRDYVAGLLRNLGLPFRILKLCGGDMSFASALTFDMEVFSAAQKRWLEVSSVSNFETFQSNRMKLRYKKDKDKPVLAHTLNGSALALPRIVASLLENNQDEKGIRIPEVLIPYTKFEYIS